MPYLWCKSSNDVPNWALSSKARRIFSSHSSFFAALDLTRGMVAVVRWWIKNSRRGGVLKCGVWVRTDEFCAIPLLVVSDFRVSCVSRYPTWLTSTLGIPKFEWVSNSPDFERIWTLLKRRIQRCRASERVTTVTEMKAVLVEEWEKITVEEDRKSTRLNSSHSTLSRMPSSA